MRFRLARPGGLLYFDEERMAWWPLLEREQGRYFPLFEKAIPLTFAQGVVEAYLETLEREKSMIMKEANWRDQPMTQGQAYILDKYRVGYTKDWTRGMASDEIGKRFAKRQVKNLKQVFDPDLIVNSLQNERTKKRFELELQKLRQA